MKKSDYMRQLAVDFQSSPYWDELFIPEFQTIHDLFEEWAFEENNMERRYALIEAVKALRTFRMRFDELSEVKSADEDAAQDTQNFDS